MTETGSLQSLGSFAYESFEGVVEGPDRIRFKGTLTVRDPFKTVQPFIHSVHEAALASGIPKLDVDVTGLTFVNSSAVRLFVDWVLWLHNAPETQRYVLHFVTDRSSTWQRVSFQMLRSFAASVVTVG